MCLPIPDGWFTSTPAHTTPSELFFDSWKKKVLKGKHFADVEEMKQKTVEALNDIKIDKLKNF